jgi:type II secretory pathway component PulJ
MSLMRRIRVGFTIAESLVALSILFIGCLFVFRMFHLAVSTSGTLGDEALAAIIAQNRMEEIRGWAIEKESAGINFVKGDWTQFDGITVADTDDPRFRTTSHVASYPLYSPAKTIPSSKILNSSARIVKVTTEWDSKAGRKSFTLTGLIGEPLRKIKKVEYTVTEKSLGPDESSVIEAAPLDEDLAKIDDLTLHWYIEPLTANGTVSSSGFGLRAVVYNYYISYSGRIFHTEGTCNVFASTHRQDTSLDFIQFEMKK